MKLSMPERFEPEADQARRHVLDDLLHLRPRRLELGAPLDRERQGLGFRGIGDMTAVGVVVIGSGCGVERKARLRGVELSAYFGERPRERARPASAAAQRSPSGMNSLYASPSRPRVPLNAGL